MARDKAPMMNEGYLYRRALKHAKIALESLESPSVRSQDALRVVQSTLEMEDGIPEITDSPSVVKDSPSVVKDSPDLVDLEADRVLSNEDLAVQSFGNGVFVVSMRGVERLVRYAAVVGITVWIGWSCATWIPSE